MRVKAMESIVIGMVVRSGGSHYRTSKQNCSKDKGRQPLAYHIEMLPLVGGR